MDPVSGDRIAQQFNQLEHHQDAANRHSDESTWQLNMLLQWARYHDESEQALTDEYPFMDGRLAGNFQNSPGGTIPHKPITLTC